MMRVAAVLAVAVALVAAVIAEETGGDDAPRPHIFMVIVDDFGWAEVGYHRSEEYKQDVQTPTIDALVQEGIELNRHYVHYACTPNPCQPGCGMPQNMTGVAEHLQSAGYATHFVGKWDVGMTTPQHTPKGRGYDTSLNYFGHGNWMWSEAEWQGSYNHRSDLPPCEPPACFKDFWETDKPAAELNGTQYEEAIFRDRVYSILEQHDPSTPLFLTYASKVAHYPLQAPIEYQEKFSFIEEPHRRVYHAMVAFLDDNLANFTSLLKSKGMWNNTLMVLTSDNGGYVKSFLGDCDNNTSHGYACFNGEAGANYPLQGGKYSTLEGGVRVNAFVSGGFVPEERRGTREDEMVHVADWYATFAALAGVDPTDHRAAQHNLPPIDSLNIWPLLSGANVSSPRQTLLIDPHALIWGKWKVLHGNVIEANWGGPQYPNASTADDPIENYSRNCSQGCLYNVHDDPSERTDLAASEPEQLQTMLQMLQLQAQSIWSQPIGQIDPACSTAAMDRYNGFIGPWLDVDGQLL
ncbi:uncharacterized protein MONBRDRAFT_32685 [Monosiga brevicollis MX1]|uniref:Sulfatase N-terminal domain-containing protein n=1 Tax=Monosiga brevicollis TaxID=81824 RepID=A9V139_MONBE|nr:uncharacterized protein MONBRDRAFT_32685 [Monosiga brevicollis MX1]EDQ88865.1 predicted protein [Monosiga brevicollis MX1]|eukprot:XP_001746478.1 hypothetical protein [Monosiga brevicollis MX1]